MKIGRKIEKKLSGSLEIPRELISDVPKITLTGRDNLLIENYKSLVEYEKDIIRINTSEGLLKLEGGELDIKTVTDEMMEISGKITSISYEL